MSTFGPSLKQDLSPAQGAQAETLQTEQRSHTMMDSRENSDQAAPFRVLFISLHNSVRSLMAEALLRHLGGERVEVYSAGLQPTNVHPLTWKELEEQNLDITGLTAKSLDQFVGQSFDYVITLCDEVVENCAVFPDAPERIDWHYTDPTLEDEDKQQRAFAELFRGLEQRLRLLLIIGKREQQGELDQEQEKS